MAMKIEDCDKEKQEYRVDTDDADTSPVFNLAGSTMPNYVCGEFSVDKCRAVEIVSCAHKGEVKFGQSNVRPTITHTDDLYSTRNRSTSTTPSVFGTVSSDDQPDLNTRETTCTPDFSKNGWIVTRNKVCIQADIQLHCGSSLSQQKWGDNFVFAFFQTLESSSTCLTYKIPGKDSTWSAERIYDVKFPILDINTRCGQTDVGRECRRWAPYYSAVSHVSLAGKVNDIEKKHETSKKALSVLISMGDTPAVGIPQSVGGNKYFTDSTLLKNGDLCATKKESSSVLSSVQHHETYRSWIAVHDNKSGTVYPLTMFEWYFDVSAHVEGNDLVFDKDTPSTPKLPVIYTMNDPDHVIPEFPLQVLKKNSDGHYNVANDLRNRWQCNC